MGNKNSRKINNNHLDDEDINDPLFKELHLVIIGCHSSGKNAIVNAFFRKKLFTFSTSFETKHTVFGTTVTIVRAPGWSGELNLEQKHRELRQEIKDAVSSFEKGPHAIILAIKENSTLTKTTQATLEKLLTRRFWDHTIIISSEGDPEKANNGNINSIIKALNHRHCILQEPAGFDESKKLIEEIALMIAEKGNVPLHFSVIECEQHDESREKNYLVESVRRKIQKLRKLDRNSLTERTETNTYRDRLQKILKIHEGPKINSASPDQSTCEGRNSEGEERKSEAVAETHPTEASQPLGRTKMISESVTAHNAIELNRIFQCDFLATSFNVGDLQGWHGCLVKILEDLTEEQFKKKKNKICNMKEDRIPKGRVENQNRNTLAEVMIEHWGEKRSIIYTRDILKYIPRNDEKIIDLILPFLQRIGESW